MGLKITFDSGSQPQPASQTEKSSAAAPKSAESDKSLFSVKGLWSGEPAEKAEPFSVKNTAHKFGISTPEYTKTSGKSDSVPTVDLKFEDRGKNVTQLQLKYVDLGLMKSSDVPSSQRFGEITVAATKAFQASMGIPQTGNFDATTRSSMQNLYAGGIAYGARNGNVFGLQKDLVKTGYMTQAQMDSGPGNFGNQTLGALKRFQTASGLLPTGIYDVPTFTAMQTAKARSSGTTPTQGSPAPSTDLAFHHINQGQGDHIGTIGANNNCGFASAHMALSFLGVEGYEIKQYPPNATARQIAAVDRQNFDITMNLRFAGSGNRDDSANGLTPDIVKAAQSAGADAVDLYSSAVTNPDTRTPRTSEQRHSYYLDTMQTAFAGDQKVAFVVHGNPFMGWGNDANLNTAYNAGTAYNGDHFVTVLGYDDKTKKFDVLDPMATKPIQVTRGQLDNYLNAAGAVYNEVVKITPKN